MELNSVIEIIHTKASGRTGCNPIPRDEVSVLCSKKTGYYLRFSTELTQELKPYVSANIAKNTITGEVYLVMYRTKDGDQILGTTSNSNPARIINSKSFIITLADIISIPTDQPCRVKISGNLAPSKEFYTIKFNPLTK